MHRSPSPWSSSSSAPSSSASVYPYWRIDIQLPSLQAKRIPPQPRVSARRTRSLRQRRLPRQRHRQRTTSIPASNCSPCLHRRHHSHIPAGNAPAHSPLCRTILSGMVLPTRTSRTSDLFYSSAASNRYSRTRKVRAVIHLLRRS